MFNILSTRSIYGFSLSNDVGDGHFEFALSAPCNGRLSLFGQFHIRKTLVQLLALGLTLLVQV